MSEITRDEALEHFGIKGMHWGVSKAVRNEGDSPHGLSSNQKKAVAIGAGAAVLAGLAATGYILNRNGNVPMHTLIRRSTNAVKGTGYMIKNATPMITGFPYMIKGSPSVLTKGAKPMMTEGLGPMIKGSPSVMTKGTKAAQGIIHKNANVMLKDIMDAHANQSKYMRSIVPYYNPRKNPFTPEARSLLKLGS